MIFSKKNSFVVNVWLRFFEDIKIPMAFMFTVSFFSLAMPYGFPLFFPLVFFTFAWFSYGGKVSSQSNIGIILLVLSFFFYLVGLVWTGTIYSHNVKELLNAAGIFLAIPVLNSLRSTKEFYYFRNLVQLTTSWALTVVAIISIYKFILLLDGVTLPYFRMEGRQYPWGTSLVVDYNFFAFGMGVGALSALYCFVRSPSFFGKTNYWVSFCLMVLSGFLAGSRRYWIVGSAGLLVLLCLFFSQVVSHLNHILQKGVFSKNSMRTTIFLIITPAVLVSVFVRYRGNIQSVNTGAIESLLFRLGTMQDLDASFSPREERWLFALDLLDQANIGEIFFGQGFGYLARYGGEFLMTGGEDYPHNPIISALLYSGILGSIPVVSLFLIAGVKFYSNRKIDSYFFCVFLASILFLLPSSNSLFSVKFFPLLLMMPWVMGKSLSNSK